MRLPPWLLLPSLALVGAAAFWAGRWSKATRPSSPSSAVSAQNATAGLRVSQQQLRYRFPITAQSTDSTRNELNLVINALEARVNEKIASPIDLAELADTLHRRALLSGDDADRDRALHVAEESLRILPSPNAANLVLAKIANAKHDFRAARDIATQLLAAKPSVGALIVLSSAQLALGNLTAAIAAAEQAVVLTPTMESYLMRALVLQASGRDAEAHFDFAKACELEPQGNLLESARVRALWGRLLLRNGDFESAAQLFAEALRIVPEHPLSLAYQAELALRKGDSTQAKAGFERAFAKSRETRYLIDLARAQEVAGDSKAADNVREQAEKLVRVDLNSGGSGHQLELVEILTDRGTAASLAEAIAFARDELTKRGSAETRVQLARALYKNGMRDEALLQLREALATGVRDARWYELAARLEDGPRSTFYRSEADKLDPKKNGWRSLGLPAMQRREP